LEEKSQSFGISNLKHTTISKRDNWSTHYRWRVPAWWVITGAHPAIDASCMIMTVFHVCGKFDKMKWRQIDSQQECLILCCYIGVFLVEYCILCCYNSVYWFQYCIICWESKCIVRKGRFRYDKNAMRKQVFQQFWTRRWGDWTKWCKEFAIYMFMFVNHKLFEGSNGK
jgi:hypothetical protein